MNAKICFVSGSISRSGGTERVGTIIANSLYKRGYDVSILSFWNRGASYYPLESGIKVDALLDPNREGKAYRTYIYPVIKLHNYLEKNKIDIVIDIDTVLSYYTARAIIGTKCKLISWEHFNYWTMERLAEEKRFKAKELIKKYASAMIVLTNEDREKHNQIYNFQEGFVRTINNPCLSNVNPHYNFDNHTFVSLGRLASQKGYNLLLDAWNLVEKEIPDWKLIIVGKGELESELLAQKERLGLTNLIFAGHKDDVGKFYSESSGYVLSSIYEGFPMVILEAQSYGLPVISFDCKTGPRDLVDSGVNGYLVDDENIEELAKKMVLFAKNREKAYQMSKNALKNIAKYGLEPITERWVDLIDGILKG